MSTEIGAIHWLLNLDDKKFQEDLKGVSGQMKGVGDSMKNFGAKMTAAVSLPLAAIGTQAFLTAASLQDAMGATDQIFKGSSQMMKDWASNLETYYGVATNEALEYSNMMGSMLQNIGGLSEEESAKTAQSLIELAGDLTAMYGGTTADAVRALTGALKGNNTMLDNYGMVATEAMIATKAVEMGLLDEGEAMTSTAKQAATLALIMEQSTAAQGQAEREAGGASGTLRSLGTEFKNLSAEIGGVLLPILTPLLDKIKQFVISFKGMDQNTQKIIVIVGLLVAAIFPLIMVIGSVISALSAIVPIIGIVVGALSWPVVAIAALIAALVWLQVKFGIFNPLIEQVKMFVEAVVVGFNWVVEAIKKVIDFFKNFDQNIKKIWENVKMAFLMANLYLINLMLELFTVKIPYFIGAAIRFFMELPGKIPGILENLKTMAINIFIQINLLIIRIIIDLINGIVRFFQELPDKLKNIWNGIIDWLKTQPAVMMQIGIDMINGFWEGLKNAMRAVMKWVTDQVEKIKDSFKAGLKIKSPSKVFQYYGEMVGIGFQQGLKGAFSDIPTMDAMGMIGSTLSGISNDQAIATPPTYINMNMDGIIARSRAEFRDIIADGINAVNEELKAKGKALIGGEYILGTSNVK